MSIDAKIVKELRDKTGAGMMDCKRALVETDGDLVKAVEALRKAGVTRQRRKGYVLRKMGWFIPIYTMVEGWAFLWK